MQQRQHATAASPTKLVSSCHRVGSCVGKVWAGGLCTTAAAGIAPNQATSPDASTVRSCRCVCQHASNSHQSSLQLQQQGLTGASTNSCVYCSSGSVRLRIHSSSFATAHGSSSAGRMFQGARASQDEQPYSRGVRSRAPVHLSPAAGCFMAHCNAVPQCCLLQGQLAHTEVGAGG